MSKQLENQIALVTGATRGIGKAIAAQLQAQGAIVIGTATSDEGAAQIQADLEPLGGRGVCLDVTDDEATDALLAELAKERSVERRVGKERSLQRETYNKEKRSDCT